MGIPLLRIKAKTLSMSYPGFLPGHCKYTFLHEYDVHSMGIISSDVKFLWVRGRKFLGKEVWCKEVYHCHKFYIIYSLIRISSL